MQTTDVLVIGGGPAGSSCAWRLRQHGVETVLLDAQPFPRLKLCAGWITPNVLADLQFDPAQYPHRFNTFEKLVVHMFGLRVNVKTTQHSIRRFEFDDWLLRRSGVPVIQHNVREIVKDGENYLIDGQYRAKYLVGAGGSKCPVYRSLFRDVSPRAHTQQIVALEHEFPYQYSDPQCHLWFFRNKLPGYSWYVPKADGYLNIGIGGMAQVLIDRGDDIRRHWERFIGDMERTGLAQTGSVQPKAYSYYLRDKSVTVRNGNAFIVGDAIGLATADLGEGIGAAVQSGLRAADAISSGSAYSIKGIPRFTVPLLERHPLLQRMIAH